MSEDREVLADSRRRLTALEAAQRKREIEEIWSRTESLEASRGIGPIRRRQIEPEG